MEVYMTRTVLLSTRKQDPQWMSEVAAEVGFDGIELVMVPDEKGWFPLKKYATLQGVKAIHAPTGSFGAAVLEKMLTMTLKLAKELGVTVVNTHPGALSQGGRTNVERCIKVIQKLAVEWQVTVVYEVLPRPDAGKKRHDQERAYDKLGSWQVDVAQHDLPATLDTTHIASWGEQPASYVEMLGTHLRHLHISDYDPSQEPSQHLWLGNGAASTIDWPAFFTALGRVRTQDMALTFEPANRFLLHGSKRKLARSLDFIRQGLNGNV